MVVQKVIDKPALFCEIIRGLSVDDPVVRMRCADAAEKISAINPEWLQPHKRTLLALARQSTQKEIRWHLAQMLPRLNLSAAQKRAAGDILLAYLKDDSRIVQTFALQALADLAESEAALRQRLLPLLDNLHRTGSPAVQSRARKLIAHLCGT